MSRVDWPIQWGVGWGPLKLESPRAEVISHLKNEKLEFEDEVEDPEWVIVPDLNADFIFGSEEHLPLAQIALEDPDLRIHGAPVIHQKLHEVLVSLNASSSDTLWRIDFDPADNLFGDTAAVSVTASNADLLRQGTLWLRSLGVGFYLENGVVQQILLRHPKRVPTTGQGTITPQQLELSTRDDLQRYLQEDLVRRPPIRWRMRLATLGLVISLMWIATRAVEEEKKWAQAPQVQGTVLEIGPKDPKTGNPDYLVGYKDDNGVEHRGWMSQNDLYIPRELGEAVPLMYLPEEPGKPYGTSRQRDQGFLIYFPWALAAVAIYGAIWSLDKWLPRPTVLDNEESRF